jgi:predicted porin
MNRKLLAAAVAGVIAPMAAQALDVSVSGQVNRVIRFADNGVNSDVQHVDGAASGSRFAISAEGELMEGLVAGAVIEEGFTANGAVDINAPDGAKPTEINFRQSYVYFSGNFGSVVAGWTYPAGNGVEWTGYNDASAGTQYGLASNTGINVMTEDGMDAGSMLSYMPSVTIGRRNTLRYDTPSIGPVSFTASVQKSQAEGRGDSHEWSFGGYLNHDMGAASVTGGLFLMEDKFAIAGGVKFQQGTAVNATWSTNDGGTADYESRYVSVSHGWGNTSVAIGYRSADDSSTGKEAQSVGLGVNQDLGSGVSVYAGFNNYSFDKPDYALEDVNAFHIGSKVTFN